MRTHKQTNTQTNKHTHTQVRADISLKYLRPKTKTSWEFIVGVYLASSFNWEEVQFAALRRITIVVITHLKNVMLEM